MEPEDLQRFRTRLEELREELRAEGDLALENTARDGGDGKIDEDAAPLSEMNQVIASKRNAERALRLKQIAVALKRLVNEPEEFGLCGVCDEEIPEKRLWLMPWATRCVACQEKGEDDRGGRRKHLGDYR